MSVRFDLGALSLLLPIEHPWNYSDRHLSARAIHARGSLEQKSKVLPSLETFAHRQPTLLSLVIVHSILRRNWVCCRNFGTWNLVLSAQDLVYFWKNWTLSGSFLYVWQEKICLLTNCQFLSLLWKERQHFFTFPPPLKPSLSFELYACKALMTFILSRLTLKRKLSSPLPFCKKASCRKMRKKEALAKGWRFLKFPCGGSDVWSFRRKILLLLSYS